MLPLAPPGGTSQGKQENQPQPERTSLLGSLKCSIKCSCLSWREEVGSEHLLSTNWLPGLALVIIAPNPHFTRSRCHCPHLSRMKTQSFRKVIYLWKWPSRGLSPGYLYLRPLSSAMPCWSLQKGVDGPRSASPRLDGPWPNPFPEASPMLGKQLQTE